MKFKKKPFKHQLDTWEDTKDLQAYGLFWEMGCGKSKTTIDTAAHLYLTGKIDGLLVVAPNGVHANWTTDELPSHMPDEVPYLAACYHSKRSKTRKHQRAVESAVSVSDALGVLVMSYSAFITERGKKAAKAFLTKRRCLMVLDESTRIKTPSARRTKVILGASKHAPYRRILTGTPVANSPFDVYTQMRFLDMDFWKETGIASFTVFKRRYGVWEDMYRGGGGKRFPVLMYYKNISELHERLKTLSDRKLKVDVLDLPPKMYSRHTFELTAKQRALYNELKENFIIELDSGEDIAAPLALVRLLRFQQITCNYLPTEEGPVLSIEETNPRLKLLESIIEDVPHQAIIWARFTKDIDDITNLLGDNCVRYDGSTGPEQREEAKRAFQAGEKQFFVANPAAAGEGLTLHAARTVVYYNNSFNLNHRLQSEDRAHRIGQHHPVQYIDIVADKTVDEHIVKKLRDKRNIAGEVTGDELREWL